MTDQEKTEEVAEGQYLDEGIEPLSTEFFSMFTQRKNFEFYELFFDVGVSIFEDGRHKFKRPIFREVVQDLIKAWCSRLVTRDEFREYIGGLGTGKMTRYKLESILAKREREAKKG